MVPFLTQANHSNWLERQIYEMGFTENGYPARSSNDSDWPKVQSDGETVEDLRVAFSQAGVAISPDQLRRWRDQGLMPRAKQIGLGRAAGSMTEYPLGTAQLALEIQRLLTVKKKASFVGWQLWMQGYEVDDSYWKPQIQSAAYELKRIPAWLRLLEIQNQSDSETIFDQIPKHQFGGTLFAKGLARLAPDMVAFVFASLADVARGQYVRIDYQDQSDGPKNLKAMQQMIGQPLNSIVANIPFDTKFGLDMQEVLLAVSDSMTEILKTPAPKIAEITPSTRVQFIAFVVLASELMATSTPIAKSQIGRFATALLSDQKAQSYALIIWSVFCDKAPSFGENTLAEMVNDWISELGS